MKRIILASVTLIALAWLSGCSSNSTSSFTGNTTPSPSLLSGQFGFVLSGFDASASTYVPIVMAGSLTADGKGNITASEVDVNDNGTTSSSSSLTGTYSFDTFQSGTIGLGALGTITLTSTVGSVTHPLKFAFSLNSTGTFAGIMDLSLNNFITAGTMQKQTAALTLSSLQGSYVVEFKGKTQTLPTAAIGRLTLGSSGTVSAASFDRSISSVGTAGPNTTAAITAFSAPDPNGRGTFTINLADALAATPTQTFAYYAISSSRFIAAEIDGVGTMMVDAESQGATPPAAGTLTGSVFGMAGVDTAIPSEISAVGQLVISSSTVGTVADDSNDNGAIFTNAALAIPMATYSTTTGRGTVAITNGHANGLADSLVFYLTSANVNSFILDATLGASNRAISGPLWAQSGVGSFSTATDLPGAAIVRGKGAAQSDASAFIAAFSLTNVAGNYALVDDQRFPATQNSTTLTTSTDSAISPVTVGGLIATTGRGTFLNGSETLAFYAIQPNQFVFIDISPSGNVNNGPSPLFIATPN